MFCCVRSPTTSPGSGCCSLSSKVSQYICSGQRKIQETVSSSQSNKDLLVCKNFTKPGMPLKMGFFYLCIRSLLSLMHAYDARVRHGHSERGNQLGQWRLTPSFVLEGCPGYHRGSRPFDRQQTLKSPLYSVFSIANVVGPFLVLSLRGLRSIIGRALSTGKKFSKRKKVLCDVI